MRNYRELSLFLLGKSVFIRLKVHERSLYRWSQDGCIPGEQVLFISRLVRTD